MIPLDAAFSTRNPLLLVLYKIVVAIIIYLKAVIAEIFSVVKVKTILAKDNLFTRRKVNTD